VKDSNDPISNPQPDGGLIPNLLWKFSWNLFFIAGLGSNPRYLSLVGGILNLLHAIHKSIATDPLPAPISIT